MSDNQMSTDTSSAASQRRIEGYKKMLTYIHHPRVENSHEAGIFSAMGDLFHYASGAYVTPKGATLTECTSADTTVRYLSQ